MYEVEEINIEKLIYNIRGKQVMLDRDLAKLYGCKNGIKSINLAVKRNIYRFPEDFCFQLTEEEYRRFQVQNETSNLEKNYSRFQFETLNNPKNNRITVRLDNETFNKLNNYCEKENINYTDAIRNLIKKLDK